MKDIEELKESKPNNDGKLKGIVTEFLKCKDTPEVYEKKEFFNQTLRSAAKKFKLYPPKRDLGKMYKKMSEENPNKYPIIPSLVNLFINNTRRTLSGITNITVVMPPDPFSCEFNCLMCPDQKISKGAKEDMPRSYLSNEDACARAKKVGFDPIKQVHVRISDLIDNGHNVDKIEFRILGGTFSCYPKDMATDFIHKLYYAANIFDPENPKHLVPSKEEQEENLKKSKIPYKFGLDSQMKLEKGLRDLESMREEQNINETAKIHVVGMGIETRPDKITEDEILRLRFYGVTRVELGIQHTDNKLLKKINRGHGVEHSRRGCRLLRDYGFKLELHIMADLPDATPEGDKECYRQVLQSDPDLMPDYLKDYPCLAVDYTVVKEWREAGTWKPYSEKTEDASLLRDVLIYKQKITPPWVRVNRVQRDFHAANEETGEEGYHSTTIPSNLSQLVKEDAEKLGIYCQCMRCREVLDEKFDKEEIVYRTYIRDGGGNTVEYHFSAQVPRPHRNLELGIVRLRLTPATLDSKSKDICGITGLVREAHVYGQVVMVGNERNFGAQHMGIGTNLMKIAEEVCDYYKTEKIAVISAIGSRGFYRKLGYELGDTYMVKKTNNVTNVTEFLEKINEEHSKVDISKKTFDSPDFYIISEEEYRKYFPKQKQITFEKVHQEEQKITIRMDTIFYMISLFFVLMALVMHLFK